MRKKPKKRCSCGSGKEFTQCCKKASLEKKLELERAARRFSDFGMHAEAAEALEERAALSPDNPMIWNDLGVQRAAASHLSEAEIAFRKAYEVLPEYPIALYNLGKLSLVKCIKLRVEDRQKQDDIVRGLATEAVRYLQASVTQDPSLACAHELLNRAFEILGDQRKAHSHLSEALRLVPELRSLYARSSLEQLPMIGRLFTKANPGPDFLEAHVPLTRQLVP